MEKIYIVRGQKTGDDDDSRDDQRHLPPGPYAPDVERLTNSGESLDAHGDDAPRKSFAHKCHLNIPNRHCRAPVPQPKCVILRGVEPISYREAVSQKRQVGNKIWKEKGEEDDVGDSKKGQEDV